MILKRRKWKIAKPSPTFWFHIPLTFSSNMRNEIIHFFLSLFGLVSRVRQRPGIRETPKTQWGHLEMLLTILDYEPWRGVWIQFVFKLVTLRQHI